MKILIQKIFHAHSLRRSAFGVFQLNQSQMTLILYNKGITREGLLFDWFNLIKSA